MTGTNIRAAVKTVTVKGAGPVGLASALAIKRALPAAEVILVTDSAADGPADLFPIFHPPALAELNMLGLSEGLLARSATAGYVLAEHFTGWTNRPFSLAMCEEEPLANGVALRLIERALAAYPDPAMYSASMAMAKACRFAPAALAEDPVGETVGYALRLDKAAFVTLLRTAAERAGVAFALSAWKSSSCDPSGAIAVFMTDGTTISPDLLVECVAGDGFAAGSKGEDWILAPEGGSLFHWERPGEAMLHDQYTAKDWGWLAILAGNASTTRLAFVDAEQSRQRWRNEVPDTAQSIAILPGRLSNPMNGRRVALGDAAAMPGALCFTAFSLAMMHLRLLLELMPAAEPEPLLEREYNRRANILSDELLDFVSALHVLSAHPGAFWDRMRTAPQRSSLSRIIDGHARSGRIAAREVGLVNDARWARALEGLSSHGWGIDGVAAAVPIELGHAALAARGAAVRRLVTSQPPYGKWLRGDQSR